MPTLLKIGSFLVADVCRILIVSIPKTLPKYGNVDVFKELPNIEVVTHFGIVFCQKVWSGHIYFWICSRQVKPGGIQHAHLFFSRFFNQLVLIEEGETRHHKNHTSMKYIPMPKEFSQFIL